MRTLSIAALLLWSTLAVAQMQRTPNSPPYSTPPTFPTDKGAPTHSTPEVTPPAQPPDIDNPQARPDETPQSQKPDVDKPDQKEQLPQSDQMPKADENRRSPLAASIEKKLSAEPTLEDSAIDVSLENGKIVLSGTVNSQAQHDLAMKIAQANAGDREVVDRIKVTS